MGSVTGLTGKPLDHRPKAASAPAPALKCGGRLNTTNVCLTGTELPKVMIPRFASDRRAFSLNDIGGMIGDGSLTWGCTSSYAASSVFA